jgi:hypothetical protein
MHIKFVGLVVELDVHPHDHRDPVDTSGMRVTATAA